MCRGGAATHTHARTHARKRNMHALRQGEGVGGSRLSEQLMLRDVARAARGGHRHGRRDGERRRLAERRRPPRAQHLARSGRGTEAEMEMGVHGHGLGGARRGNRGAGCDRGDAGALRCDGGDAARSGGACSSRNASSRIRRCCRPSLARPLLAH